MFTTIGTYSISLSLDSLASNLTYTTNPQVHILQLITDISTRLRIELFGPDEMICNFDDVVGRAMYMVRDGRVLLKNGTTQQWSLLQGYKISLLRKRHEKELVSSPTTALKRAMSSNSRDSFTASYTSTFDHAHESIMSRKNSQQDIHDKLRKNITQVRIF